MELHDIKNPLLRNFLKESSRNQELYAQWVGHHDRNALDELNENFKQFFFRIHLYSYIGKSLSLKAREIKKKHNMLKDMEELSLNSLLQEGGEEVVRTIPAEPVDFEAEYAKHSGHQDFVEYVSDKKLLDAINGLSVKQYRILYMHIIRDMKEADIAKALDISIQAVNKSKNKAIKKIRSILEVD